MKKALQFFVGALFAAVALAVLNLAFADPAQAAVNRNEPLPMTWASRTAGKAFSLNASAVPVVTTGGTNYTAITTNIALFGGSTNQFRIRVKNGLVVGVVGPAEDN